MPDRGYLACIENIPPLIFRFQFNPDLLQEKKSYKYQQANAFGTWGFSTPSSGFTGFIGDVYEDIKELGPLLVATRPYEAIEGEPRTFALDFVLDARHPETLDTVTGLNPDGLPASTPPAAGSVTGELHRGGTIEPDLAVLRSFMNPSVDLIDVTKWIFGGDKPCWQRPPLCTLVLGAYNIGCVMTDLNIKVTSFKENLVPERAEISATLREQTHSLGPFIDTFERYAGVIKSYDREGIGQDFVNVLPGSTALQNLFGEF